mmetsp:Transcript_24035/g.74106  ORF Transcript_24035/g.74106 Transcript_24035/m.74106 type:complete len:457 (-) Transcript_24035:39-1409(-)
MASMSDGGIDYYADAGTVDASSIADVAAVAARKALTQDGDFLVLALVGMPARGKSFIGAKLRSFLRWSGLNVRVFNAGKRRRRMSTPQQQHHKAAFFDAANSDARDARERIAMETLDALFAYFESGEGEVGIFDATNSTKERRAAILERARRRFAPSGKTCGVVFVETICDDPHVLEANMLTKVRNSPDFEGMDEAAALTDLKQRTAHYEAAYESLEDGEGASYIKLYNFSSKVTCSLCYGRVTRVVLPFLMAVHVDERPIYLVAIAPRAGEAEYAGDVDADHDAVLGARLNAWCEALPAPPSVVFASTAPGAYAVAEGFVDGAAVVHRSDLDPFFNDPAHPWPSAHRDLAARLENVLIDIEASVAPTLVITHATPARALRAFFLDKADVKVVEESATTEGPRALAGSKYAVVEIMATVAGGYSENVHLLDAGEDTPSRRPSVSRRKSMPWHAPRS